MFTSIIKDLLGTKIAECNKIYNHVPSILIDDEYESSNTDSQKKIKKHILVS